MHICTYVIVTIAIYDGDATAAVLTLDTAIGENRKEIVDRVARFPARACTRDRSLCYYFRLKFDCFCFSDFFSLICFLVSSLFLIPVSLSVFLVLLRSCSSYLFLSSTYVFL